MNIECSKEKLKQSVLQLEKVVSKNISLPILNTILLVAEGKRLVLRATNLDVGLEIEIAATVDEGGSVAIPAGVFAGLLSSLGAEKTITLKEKGGNIEVSCGSNKTLIKCLPVDEFPTLPIVNEGEHLSLPTESIIDGITSVSYSASLSEVKPELASVYMYIDDRSVFFVATDSFRLAEKKISVKDIKDIPGIIIPFKNAVIIARSLEGYTGDASIYFSKNQIAISLDSFYITSRIIDGVFPDYKQIIPREHKTEVVLLKQDILQALKVSNIFTNKFHQVSLSVSPKNKSVRIETKSSDVGESVFNIDASLKGEDVEVSLNYKYIMEAFQSLHTDSLAVELGGPNKPVVIRGVGDKTFTYLIMPMNK